jgi:hypothetical protein
MVCALTRVSKIWFDVSASRNELASSNVEIVDYRVGVMWRAMPGSVRQSISIEDGRAVCMTSGLAGFLYSVYVLIAFAFGEYRVIDGAADAKGKLQLAVF